MNIYVELPKDYFEKKNPKPKPKIKTLGTIKL